MFTPHLVSITRVNNSPRRKAQFTQISPYPKKRGCVRWLAELMEWEATIPLAIVYLSEWRNARPPYVLVEYVLVPDPLRQRGHAMTLLLACEQRFGKLTMTDPIAPGGAALLKAWQRLKA